MKKHLCTAFLDGTIYSRPSPLSDIAYGACYTIFITAWACLCTSLCDIHINYPYSRFLLLRVDLSIFSPTTSPLVSSHTPFRCCLAILHAKLTLTQAEPLRTQFSLSYVHPFGSSSRLFRVPEQHAVPQSTRTIRHFPQRGIESHGAATGGMGVTIWKYGTVESGTWG